MAQPPDGAPDTRELLADFGEVMLEIQLFEFTLVGLVQVQGNQLRGTPDYGRFIEELFSLTAGQLRRRARIEDDELAKLVEDAVKLRNGLVHGWLIFAGMDAVSGRETTDDQRQHLQTARRVLGEIRSRLGVVWEQGLAGLDDEKLTTEQVAELWRQRQGDTDR